MKYLDNSNFCVVNRIREILNRQSFKSLNNIRVMTKGIPKQKLKIIKFHKYLSNYIYQTRLNRSLTSN